MMPGYTASPDAAATDDVYTLPGKLQLNTLGVGGRGGYLSVITTWNQASAYQLLVSDGVLTEAKFTF